MSGLNALKFTTSKRQQGKSPQQERRLKLCNKLDEQIQLAKAEQSGSSFVLTKTRNIRDSETGESRKIEVPRKLKPWWWMDESGKLCITVRYGAKVLELVDGKNAIEADSIADVVTSLQVIRTAINSVELDARIQALAGKNEVLVPKAPPTEKKGTLKLPFRNN
jgi:hypothetical protein